MKETICTIPINDIFNLHDGCPFCRMYEMLENQYATFITGSAMMEPNTRVATNKKGFCPRHFEKIVEVGKRLPVALILETHLAQISDGILPKKAGKPDKKALAKVDEIIESCYICDRIQFDIEHFLQTVFAEWVNSPEFKETYKNQDFICLRHYSQVMKYASVKMPSKHLSAFHEDTLHLTRNYLETLQADTTHFCRMFDYRNQGGDWGNSKDAIERDISFLSGYLDTSVN
ncbi:MAG: hypothetical protein IJF52_04700 [Clostridia bacterium]|nr:hypothetical protein [Clostridia bacterium]